MLSNPISFKSKSAISARSIHSVDYKGARQAAEQDWIVNFKSNEHPSAIPDLSQLMSPQDHFEGDTFSSCMSLHNCRLLLCGVLARQSKHLAAGAALKKSIQNDEDVARPL